jgi:hypothetical protein
MVGSIDPRYETVRGIHWPETGRGIVWNSRRGNHLGQRSIATASNRPDIWMQAIRSDRQNSCGTGAVHIWHGGRPHKDYDGARMSGVSAFAA